MDNNMTGQPFNVCDVARKSRKVIEASGFQDLTSKLSETLNLNSVDQGVRVVLEVDGTEIDDEDYFATLEPNTNLMILCGRENWLPGWKSVDQTDAAQCAGDRLSNLVHRLKENILQIFLLGETDLRLLSDMDPDSTSVPSVEKKFLEQLQETTGRMLCEKHETNEAMELLHLYHKTVSGDSETPATTLTES